MGGTGAGLCCEPSCNLSARLGPEDMLASHERSWADLEWAQLVSLWLADCRASSYSCNLNDSLSQFVGNMPCTLLLWRTHIVLSIHKL